MKFRRPLRNRPAMRHLVLAVTLAVPLIALQNTASGQVSTRVVGSPAMNENISTPQPSGLLRQFNDSLVDLAKKVTPAVVQIMVTSYGPIAPTNKTGNVSLFARQHGIGSGVIVDANGYIITNAHVVEGAQRIRVILSPSSSGAPFDNAATSPHRVLEAKVIGIDAATDLALLKVDAQNLPVLALAPFRAVNPGEIVLAIGSPEGLQSSVSMGIVSSVWRQPDPDEAGVYIQTDAPINPGNSGGPLVDIDGYVIGLNAMILTEGGGSEGLGFAIPARTVQFVYEDLRKYGHVQRTEIGVSTQEITPGLAEGLRLFQDWGVIISDVSVQGAGADAGLKVGDIILSVDGRRITRPPDLAAALYLHSPDQSVLIDVLRESQKVAIVVPAVQHSDKRDDLAHLIAPQDLVGQLGVFVHDLDKDVRDTLPSVQSTSGVVVVAQSSDLSSYTSSLRAGDILHSLNQKPIESVKQLRSMLRDLKSGHPVVLQIERSGKLQYVSFEWGD